ncbi:hypothetical protein QZH41_020550 [Actinostola sp. cb2023]|nr:hypothetical protein QZH41_020550 [Actinostola sp. cb2023]
MRGTPPRYKLNEWDGDPIEGSFYEEEFATGDSWNEQFTASRFLLRASAEQCGDPRPDEHRLGLRGAVTPPVEFRDRRLVLPSSASKDLYPDNTGHTYTVHLPAALNYVPDDWEVGMVYLTTPVPHGRIEELSQMHQMVGWDG